MMTFEVERRASCRRPDPASVAARLCGGAPDVPHARAETRVGLELAGRRGEKSRPMPLPGVLSVENAGGTCHKPPGFTSTTITPRQGATSRRASCFRRRAATAPGPFAASGAASTPIRRASSRRAGRRRWASVRRRPRRRRRRPPAATRRAPRDAGGRVAGGHLPSPRRRVPPERRVRVGD